jgi:hypothetical protein
MQALKDFPLSIISDFEARLQAGDVRASDARGAVDEAGEFLDIASTSTNVFATAAFNSATWAERF